MIFKSVPNIKADTLIIGGGSTGTMAAIRAKGVEQVGIVCLERTKAEMAAYSWAIDEALEEGISIEWGWGPFSFADTNGTAGSFDCHR